MQSPQNQNAQIIGLQKNGATLWTFLGTLQEFIKSPEKVEQNIGKLEDELAKLNTDLDKIGNTDATALNDFINKKITGPDRVAVGKAMVTQIDGIREIQNLLQTAHAMIDYKNLSMDKYGKYESLVHSKIEALMSLILTPDIEKYLLTANTIAIQEKTQERDKVDLEIGSLTIKSGKNDKGAKVQLQAKIQQAQGLDENLSKLQEEKVKLLIQQAKKDNNIAPLLEERSRLESQEALKKKPGGEEKLSKNQVQIGQLQSCINEIKTDKQEKTDKRLSTKKDETIKTESQYPDNAARRSTISKHP